MSQKIEKRIINKLQRLESIGVFNFPGNIHLFFSADNPLTHSPHAKKIKLNFDFILTIFKGSNLVWVYNKSLLIKRSEELIKNTKFINREFRRWEDKERRFYELVKKIEKGGINDITLDYINIYNAHSTQWAYGIIPEYFLNYSEYISKKLIKKYPKLHSEINILSSPKESSFLSVARKNLFEIAFTKNKESTARSYLKKYYWLYTNYLGAKALTEEDILKEIKTAKEFKGMLEIKKDLEEIKDYKRNIKKEKLKIKRANIFTKQEIKILELISFMAGWQDRRKKAGLIGTYWQDVIIRKAAKEKNISRKILYHMLPSEFIDFLQNKRIDLNSIKKRFDLVVQFRNKNGRIWWLNKNINPFLLSLVQAKPRSHQRIKVIKGLTASGGVVSGKIKVVLNPRSNVKMSQGEILVTAMTRPDFMPLVNKSAAIITDEGGLACHAAIISRELKIPCIVGTKTATRVLRNGDLVEVDANKGIVRLIKKINK